MRQHPSLPGTSPGAVRIPTTWVLLRRSPALQVAGFALVYGFAGLVFLVLAAAAADGEEVSLVGYVLLVLAVLALAGWMLWRASRDVRDGLRVLRRGKQERGVVVAVEERAAARLSAGWILLYAYNDDANRRHTGEVRLPAREARLWRAGDSCVVMFDASEPRCSVWISHRDEGATASPPV